MQITDKKHINTYYKALVEKDREYLGLFFVGVKTTGIFCIPTCRARKPKFENVEFFTELKDLLQHGYRPCKICKPTENVSATPDFVNTALDLIKQNPKQKIKDYALKEAGVQPEKIRRWFQEKLWNTFHAYQRMLRINKRISRIKGR